MSSPIAECPGLYQLDSGSWFIDRRIRGKRYRVSLRTPSETRARIDYAAFSIDPDAYVNKMGVGIKLAKAIKTFVGQSYTVNRVGKLHRDEQRRSLALLNGPERLRQWRPHHVEESLAAMAEYAPSTISRRLVIWKGFFNWCVRREHISRSPAEDVRGPKPTKNSSDRLKVIDEGLIRELDFASVPRLKSPEIKRAMVVALWGTALRLGELSRVRLIDVHQEERMLFVRTPNKGKRGRHVPISDEGIQTALNICIAANIRGDMPPAGALSRSLASVQRRAGLARFTPHDLRHTRITLWAQDRNVSPFTVSRWAGHSSMEITMGYYHMTPDQRPQPSGFTPDDLLGP